MSQQLSPGAETIVDERTHERPDYRVEEGKVWVPSRDPERFPVCPECQEIWESLDPGGDED